MFTNFVRNHELCSYLYNY